MSLVREISGGNDVGVNYPNETRILPLVLAGPILRRVETTGVTVWVALKASRTVTLRVYDSSDTAVMTGSADTVRLGKHLHAVAVAATSETELQSGQLYEYDLEFGDGKTLSSSEVLSEGSYSATVTYSGQGRPSFALPPTEIDDLHIVHASCRKPHGQGHDALPAVDAMLRDAGSDPTGRPHQLFLTGDQIYADDVADSLLSLLRDSARTLLGWDEVLPFGTDGGNETPLSNTAFDPGERQEIVNDKCGLSSGHADSHLVGLGEFYAMYLCAWSDALWPESVTGLGLTEPDDPTSKDARISEYGTLSRFRWALPVVRRVLANVPTYMIFDDHEVTDDWYLNGEWVRRVLRKPGGRRVVQNGMIAYAVFQAWGNTPDQFEATETNPSAGWQLLDAISVSGDTESRTDIDRPNTLDQLLGIPDPGPDDDDPIRWPRETGGTTVRWDYAVRPNTGASYEVVVLDTRTWRGFTPGDDPKPPRLLNDPGFDAQLPAPDTEVNVSFVVSPVPLWGHPSVEGLQGFFHVFAGIPILGILVKWNRGEAGWPSPSEIMDFEHWRLQESAMERFVAELATRRSSGSAPTRVVVLGGDVHHAFATKTQYWAKKPFEHQSPRTAVVAGFTSSPARNEDDKTRDIWRSGYDFYSLFAPGNARWDRDQLPEYAWWGWNDPVSVGNLNFVGLYFDLNERPAVTKLASGVDVPPADVAPDWIYRVDYRSAVENLSDQKSVPRVNQSYAQADARIKDDIDDDHAGMEVVGKNNVGEVTFGANGQSVSQKLWWWVGDPDMQTTALADLTGICPITDYELTFSLEDQPTMADPTYPGGGD